MSPSIYVPGSDEYTGSNTDFGTLTEDEYRVRIESYKRVNRVSQYNPEGKETIDFVLKPLAYADDEDSPLSDENGNAISDEKHILFFYDPHRLGVRPMISKSRKFLAAAMGIPADGPISLPGGYDELIGKELIAAVGIRNNRNYVSDTRPIRKRARTRTAEPTGQKQNMVNAARDTFGDDIEF